LLHSPPALTFRSNIDSVRSFAGASKGEGGERACFVRKQRLRRSWNRTDSLADLRSREGTTKVPHNRRMGEEPDGGE